MTQQTIYALSTVYGKSGVAVIRISGHDALNAIRMMTKLDVNKIAARHTYLTTLFDVQKLEPLDHALLIYFQAPYSYTGEDVVEIHTHGSKAVLNSVLLQLAKIENFRLAEPGEYSKRAFYNHKMDLTEAEGLADLIDSETAAQQKQALKQMSGNLKNLYSSWRQKLIEILSYLEAYIDFPDENIPQSTVDLILERVRLLKSEIEKHLSSSTIGERLREGFRVVLTGPVNAGKSSLINAIVERQAVIVSDIEGTTRDAIDLYLDISGYPVILTDTAGLRVSEDEIEKQGIQIARQKISEADLILALFDASSTQDINFFDTLDTSKNNIIFVANKADKITHEQYVNLTKKKITIISAKTKEGLPDLLSQIKDFLKKNIDNSPQTLITRARYREALQQCLSNLSNFSLNKQIELSAEDIRLATRSIGKITGEIEIGEILDKIFGSFCIGK